MLFYGWQIMDISENKEISFNKIFISNLHVLHLNTYIKYIYFKKLFHLINHQNFETYICTEW